MTSVSPGHFYASFFSYLERSRNVIFFLGDGAYIMVHLTQGSSYCFHTFTNNESKGDLKQVSEWASIWIFAKGQREKQPACTSRIPQVLTKPPEDHHESLEYHITTKHGSSTAKDSHLHPPQLITRSRTTHASKLK